LYPSRTVPTLKAEITDWIDKWHYSRFVTLATNDPKLAVVHRDAAIPGSRMRDRLREFDGRMNHAILGRHWAKRDADRIWAFWFLEKPEINPHWHGLVRFFPVENMTIAEQEAIFDQNAELIWKKLVPTGSVDVQPITVSRGVIEYVGKMLGYPVSFESFVTPDELVRG
jgi:hypothetical protein